MSHCRYSNCGYFDPIILGLEKGCIRTIIIALDFDIKKIKQINISYARSFLFSFIGFGLTVIRIIVK